MKHGLHLINVAVQTALDRRPPPFVISLALVRYNNLVNRDNRVHKINYTCADPAGRQRAEQQVVAPN